VKKGFPRGEITLTSGPANEKSAADLFGLPRSDC